MHNLTVDRILNPFAPGAGTPPPELAGRDEILESASVLLGRVMAGRAAKSLLLTGLRGVGKTVLLNEIERLASSANWQTISVEAQEGKSLGHLLGPHLKRVLLDLDRMAGAREKVKRALVFDHA